MLACTATEDIRVVFWIKACTSSSSMDAIVSDSLNSTDDVVSWVSRAWVTLLAEESFGSFLAVLPLEVFLAGTRVVGLITVGVWIL